MNGPEDAGVTSANKNVAAMQGEGATRKLAGHAATLGYDALPADLVALLKLCVLDTLGVCIGATGLAQEASAVADFVSDMSGKPESSILGFGGKAPAAWAAFANGSFGHMLDYDDIGDNNHTSIATIPAAFAVGEKLGGISGRDLITAVAGGSDVHTRINAAIDIPAWTMTEGWFGTQLIGFISGAATAGRLLGLDMESMDNAFGIGFNQCCGSRQMAVGNATHMRSMQAGFSGQGAVLAAQLAQRGIIGSKEIIEGRYGLFKTYVRTDTPDWDALLGGLGRHFPQLGIHGFKVWPACAYTRDANSAALSLKQQHRLRPEEIESIAVIGGSENTRFLSEPVERKRRPKNAIDGKFSIPFTVAVMMLRGDVTLRDYTDAGLRDPDVLALADKVSYRRAADPQSAAHGVQPKTWVEIRTKNGKVLNAEADGVPGDPSHPVDRKLLETKFRDCVSFSAKPLPAKNVDRAIEMIFDLENVTDATQIVRLLS